MQIVRSNQSASNSRNHFVWRSSRAAICNSRAYTESSGREGCNTDWSDRAQDWRLALSPAPPRGIPQAASAIIHRLKPLKGVKTMLRTYFRSVPALVVIVAGMWVTPRLSGQVFVGTPTPEQFSRQAQAS